MKASKRLVRLDCDCRVARSCPPIPRVAKARDAEEHHRPSGGLRRALSHHLPGVMMSVAQLPALTDTDRDLCSLPTLSFRIESQRRH